MAASWRRWRLPGLIVAVVLATGCNLTSLPYFLLFGNDNRYPPECPVFDKPKKEIKVLLLASLGTETRPELLRADRDLAEELARYLREQYKETKAKITIIPTAQVETFKDKTPDWQLDLPAVGRRFQADFIVNLDLDKLSLYEAKSLNEFFRGHAEVSVTVLDMDKLEDGPVWRHEYSYTFPTHGPRPVMDNPNPVQFRSEFLTYMVKELGRCFSSYTMEQKYDCD
jgi:hypothetical protein